MDPGRVRLFTHELRRRRLDAITRRRRLDAGRTVPHILYHGTSRDYLESVVANGLRASRPGCPVYLTPDLTVAQIYAASHVQRGSFCGCVFSVRAGDLVATPEGAELWIRSHIVGGPVIEFLAIPPQFIDVFIEGLAGHRERGWRCRCCARRPGSSLRVVGDDDPGLSGPKVWPFSGETRATLALSLNPTVSESRNRRSNSPRSHSRP